MRKRHEISNRAARTTVAMLLLLALPPASGWSEAGFEKPPVLNAKDLAPANLLKGNGFRVDDNVPTDGVMGTYTIRADAATFHADAGVYSVRGRDMLAIRVGEMPAIATLVDASKTAAFAKAMGAAAVRPLDSAVNIAMNPVETVSGIPGGVDRLFGRVEMGADRLWGAADDSSKSDLDRADDVAKGVGVITADSFGYEQERRTLAKKLHVDPYTSNPILAKQLDQVAWAAFAGRVTVNLAISAAAPGSLIISGISTTDQLIWDTTRGDLIVRVQTKLEGMKIPPERIAVFTHSPALPLSLQVAVVETLGRLEGVPGRDRVVALIAAAISESQARFLATTLRMLADYHEKQTPLTAIAAPGPLAGRDRNGALILPASVDYLSWTERVAGFATSPTFLAMPQRTLWISGKMSPRTKKELEANGWTIREATAR